MNKKTLKTIATGAAITLATVGTSTVSADTQYGIVLNRVTGEWQTVNNATGEIVKSVPNETYSSYEEAETSLMASTIETPVTTETPAVETTAVETSKTSADVKPALDAQQAVVDATVAETNQAQADADTANQDVTTAQADVDTATQAVKDAEANTVNATPENIAANQADQTANLADQAANATETDEVNAEIASQTQTVADAQTAVDTAQAEKDAADATVVSKQADVKAAQDALSGTGLAEAQATLEQTTADVATATTALDAATKAANAAKKTDTERQTAIDTATTDVAVKTDAVTTASAKLTAAQSKVASTTDALTKATDAVKSAQNALALTNADTVTIVMPDTLISDEVKQRTGFASNVVNFKTVYEHYMKNRTSQWSLTLTGQGVKVAQASRTNISLADKNEIVNIDNLTNEQKISASQLYAQGLTQIRQALNGLPTTAVTQAAIDLAQFRADQYEARGTSPLTDGHIGAGVENLILLGSKSIIQTEQDLKRAVYDALLNTSFADAPSDWGHLRANLNFANNIGIAIANINGSYWLVVAFTNEGTPITNPNDPATLQAALAKAQADQSAAQAASDTAQANLVKASSDYAKALELKTQAEKTLADATATPLQTQVAENNLRLATIALQNAEARKADAQKAVDNFSADLATKKAALDAAKTELAQAQATATAKAEALETAKVELAKQQGTLDSLNKDKDALLAEKDRLVEEAKALATELKGYLEAPAILANAQATLTEKQAALTEAQAKAETAKNKLETVTAKLAEEKAKLAELQAEYDKLKDLEDKAKNNVIATLPDGTVIAVPKVAPTVAEKPAIDIDAVKQALDKGQDVTVVDGKVVVTNPQAGVTVTPQGITYSRAERAKALPQTGEQESILGLVGLAMMSTLGLAGARRKRRG
ncbi:TPA: SEC10/PgrA surface exclusion domain-containing protein [Streptococcus suis]|nr:SEC10/PgrA surface exclusion domain-containing protein [Streptococcus suis]HEM6009011.1 SEC10/PgrA surface exclusion domain-containing protein [Streptococcus suis]HEM6015158.1 SEC10/PgrA surface exclusion domain-containing protein [Streptococcus suis]HEM6030737.1 SEC10/PgrA surface exclusion domain-containing protein [Streptococcus suis]HEM6353495.1 SEC10/PgrA surface exclusion domain-containing protein [Streptococcus suis]